MQNRILVDVDGVLLDYYTNYMEWLGYGHLNNDGNEYRSIEDALLKYMSLHHIRDSIDEFNNSEHFSRIPPIEGAVTALNELYDQGFEIDVISSCGDSTTTLEYRTKNLKDSFGDIFNEITLIPLRTSKQPYLEKHRDSGHVWVEDSVTNYHHGYEIGLRSVLITGLFQESFDNEGMIVFNNWNQINTFIEDYHRSMVCK